VGTAPPQARTCPSSPATHAGLGAIATRDTTGVYGHLPLSFEANQGQTDAQVQFLAHGQGYTLFLTASEAVFAFSQLAAHGSAQGLVPRPRAVQDTPDTARAVVHMQLLGPTRLPKCGVGGTPGKANYFRATTPAVADERAHLRQVQYTAAYPGVT